MRTSLFITLLSVSVLGCKSDPQTDDTSDTQTDDTGIADDTGTVSSGLDWLMLGGGAGFEEWLADAEGDADSLVVLGQHQSVGAWWRDTEGEVELVAEGDSDAFIASVDPADGALLSLQEFDGSGSLAPHDLALDPAGRVAAVLEFDGQTLLGEEELTPEGFSGILLVVLDTAGALESSLRIDTDASSGFFQTVSFDADGGVLLGLSTSGEVVIDPTGDKLGYDGGGGSDAVALRVDPEGSVDWVREVAVSGEQFWGAAAPLSDGGYVQAVSLDGSHAFGTDSGLVVSSDVGGSDVVVVAYDAEGIATWATVFGSTAEDGGSDVVIGSDGAIWVAGQYAFGAGADLMVDGDVALTGTAGTTGARESDAFVARLDPDTGAVQQVVGLSTTLSDSPNEIVPMSDGGVVVVGQTLGAFSPGDTEGSWSDGETVSASSFSRWAVEVGADGVLGQRMLGGYSSALGGVLLDDGDLVLAGGFASGATFGEGSQAESPDGQGGSVDGFLSREDFLQ